MTNQPPAAAPQNLPDFDPSAIPVGRFHAWWRGDPLPALPPLSNLMIDPIGDPRRASEAIDLPPDEIQARMARGHRPWWARIRNEPVGWGWSAAREFAIGELGIARSLPPRTRYLWDFATRPEQRGRGIYPRLLQAIVVGEPEVERFWVGHDLDNTSSERGIAKAGFGEVGLLYRGDSGFSLIPSGPLDRAVVASALFDVPIAATISAMRHDQAKDVPGENDMQIPTTGVHHITLIGSNRQDIIDFYEGVLGMPLVFEQPNLDVPEETHLYFDAGDGNLITFFVREKRETDSTPVPEVVGNVHHIAYAVSRETFDRAAAGLESLGFPNTGRVDRGFMDSLYFRDPNGLLLELATYTFQPPEGVSRREVFELAHRLRVEKGDYAIAQEHLNEAIARLQPAAAVT